MYKNERYLDFLTTLSQAIESYQKINVSNILLYMIYLYHEHRARFWSLMLNLPLGALLPFHFGNHFGANQLICSGLETKFRNFTQKASRNLTSQIQWLQQITDLSFQLSQSITFCAWKFMPWNQFLSNLMTFLQLLKFLQQPKQIYLTSTNCFCWLVCYIYYVC